MADSQPKLDWTTVRQVALECLRATWDLIWWADRSLSDDYDAERAALHLAAIDKAGEVITRAIEMFLPQHFDDLAQAMSGEQHRPDFQFGGVCCATAHESAFLLLRSAVHRIELDLEALEIGSIEQLHDLPHAESLRAVLVELGSDVAKVHDGPLAECSQVMHAYFRMANVPLKSLLTAPQLNVLKAWIDREWAAVSRTPNGSDSVGDSTPEPSEAVDSEWRGYEPRDQTAYIEASEVRQKHVPDGFVITAKQLNAILCDHPEIRRWHPRV